LAGAYAFFTAHAAVEFKAKLRRDKRPVRPAATVASGDHEHAHHLRHGHTHHGSKDPHIRLDFQHAAKMVQTVTEGLIAKDPERKSEDRARARVYQARLRELDKRYGRLLPGANTARSSTVATSLSASRPPAAASSMSRPIPAFPPTASRRPRRWPRSRGG